MAQNEATRIVLDGFSWPGAALLIVAAALVVWCTWLALRRGGARAWAVSLLCLRAAAVLGVAIALGVATCAFAADWPQYLGPQRNGVVHDAKGLARSWPATGPKVVWEKPGGPGYGGAAIHGDSVFLLDREDDARDVARAFRKVYENRKDLLA